MPELLAGRGMLALLPNRSASSGLLPSLCASMVFFLPEDTPLLANRQLQLLPDPPGQKLAYLGLPIRRYRLQDGRILYHLMSHLSELTAVVSVILTRRFLARFAGVSLGAMGSASARPSDHRRLPGT